MDETVVLIINLFSLYIFLVFCADTCISVPSLKKIMYVLVNGLCSSCSLSYNLQQCHVPLKTYHDDEEERLLDQLLKWV